MWRKPSSLAPTYRSEAREGPVDGLWGLWDIRIREWGRDEGPGH